MSDLNNEMKLSKMKPKRDEVIREDEAFVPRVEHESRRELRQNRRSKWVSGWAIREGHGFSRAEESQSVKALAAEARFLVQHGWPGGKPTSGAKAAS